VAENELLSLHDLDEPFRGKAREFYRLLDQFRLLTYAQLISRATAELGNPVVAEAVHVTLRHLIADEYQDVNPAQERLDRAAHLPAGRAVRGRRRRPGDLPAARPGRGRAG
jgi:DNA helicase II / ATP-dependent DNA helicase PcrA